MSNFKEITIRFAGWPDESATVRTIYSPSRTWSGLSNNRFYKFQFVLLYNITYIRNIIRSGWYIIATAFSFLEEVIPSSLFKSQTPWPLKSIIDIILLVQTPNSPNLMMYYLNTSLWEFTIAVKIFQCEENLSMWWKFSIQINIHQFD